MNDTILLQLGMSGAVVHLLELLKSKYGPRWVRGDTSTLNRWLSTFAALVVGLGIAVTGDATLGWQITIPPVHDLANAAVRVMLSRMAQQTYYQMSVKHRAASYATVNAQDTLAASGASAPQ